MTGWIIILISVVIIVSTIVYLTVFETDFHPWLFRTGIALGIFLFLIGFGVKSSRNTENLYLNLKAKRLSLGDAKSWEKGVKFSYRFDEISNLSVKSWKKQVLFLVEINKQTLVLLKIRKRKIDEANADELLAELQALLT